MQKDYKNKNITDTATKAPRADEAEQEFFFGGGGEYEPLSVKARSREEAEKIWQEQKKKVEPSQTLQTN